jgi:putative transcriptional regulator
MESVLDILFYSCYHYGKYTFHNSEERGDLKNRLEELRKQRGIRQEELAEKLEVSRQTIGSLENGRYNPSIILAIKIARFFDKSVEEIFIFEEEHEYDK